MQPRPEGEGALTGAAAPAENPRTRGPRRLGHRWSECEDRALRKLWAENISAACYCQAFDRMTVL